MFVRSSPHSSRNKDWVRIWRVAPFPGLQRDFFSPGNFRGKNSFGPKLTWQKISKPAVGIPRHTTKVFFSGKWKSWSDNERLVAIKKNVDHAILFMRIWGKWILLLRSRILPIEGDVVNGKIRAPFKMRRTATPGEKKWFTKCWKPSKASSSH